MRAIVTIRVKNRSYGQEKQTGRCPVSLSCSDFLGSHHSYIEQGFNLDEIRKKAEEKHGHVTRIEFAEWDSAWLVWQIARDWISLRGVLSSETLAKEAKELFEKEWEEEFADHFKDQLVQFEIERIVIDHLFALAKVPKERKGTVVIPKEKVEG